MEALNLLSVCLQDVQNKCIGLFQPSFDKSSWLNVVEDRDGFLICISVGDLLGLQTLYIEANQGNYVLFPENKSLMEMMKEPTEFYIWYQTQITNFKPKSYIPFFSNDEMDRELQFD